MCFHSLMLLSYSVCQNLHIANHVRIERERERNRLLTSALFNHLHLFGIVMSSKCMSYVIKRNIFLLECFNSTTNSFKQRSHTEWRDFNFVFSSKHLKNAFSWSYITTRYKQSIDYSAIFKIGHLIKRVLKMF